MDGLNFLYSVAQQGHVTDSGNPPDSQDKSNAELLGENRNLKSQVDSLQVQKASLEGEITALRTQNETLTRKLTETEEQLKLYAERIASLSSARNSNSLDSPGDNVDGPNAPSVNTLDSGSNSTNTSESRERNILDKPLDCEHYGSTFRKGGKLSQHLLKHGAKTNGEQRKRLKNLTNSEHSDDDPSDTVLESENGENDNGTGESAVVTGKTSERHCSVKCSICLKKFSSQARLDRHTRTHASGAPLKCNKCAEKFATKTELVRHLKTHKSKIKLKSVAKNDKEVTDLENSRMKNSSPDLTCEFCNRKCLSAFHLQNHLRSHTGEKPFSCDVCDKKFARKSTLRQHAIVHQEEKAWQCDVCSAKFARKDALRHHQMAHGGEKHFECDTCGKITA